jgi:hypothetical protein
MMNRRECGRKWSWPNLRYKPSIYLEALRKTIEASVRTVGPWATIWNKDLLNQTIILSNSERSEWSCHSIHKGAILTTEWRLSEIAQALFRSSSWDSNSNHPQYKVWVCTETGSFTKYKRNEIPVRSLRKSGTVIKSGLWISNLNRKVIPSARNYMFSLVATDHETFNLKQ